MAGVAVGVWATRATAERDPLAPPFSRGVETAFPGAPFVTCDLGHFEDRSTEGTSAPHRWFLKALSSGALRIEVHALGTGTAEAGALAAAFYEPHGALLAEARVPYPGGTAGAAEANVAPLSADVRASSIYRLEVRRIAPGPSVGGGHHYRLGFSGVPVEVGMNSPALPRWFEGLNLGWQVVHVHVDAGEDLRLVVTSGEGQPIPFMTVELRDRSGALLHSVTSRRWARFEVTLGSTEARTLRVALSGNHHFTLDKGSGSDRGIYFDACPPPPRPRA